MSEVLLEPPRSTEAAPATAAAAAPTPTAANSTPHLFGQRCLLRAPRLQDATVLAHIHADERVLRYEHDVEFDAEFWCSGAAYARWGAWSWAIIADSEVIGMAMICPNGSVFRCSAEVGYWISPAYWGRGITTEALSLITEWVWAARPELSRLFAAIYLPNLASQRVATKCGYVCEAVLPQSVLKAGKPTTSTLYACYRS
jgi:[ribosomal protein S5]-alanine N-acetyltransferase